MGEWQPIETAPRDRSVLVYYDHAADPYHIGDKLTDYAANAEGGGYLPGKGLALAKWLDGYYESDGWEDPSGGYWVPAGWFVTQGDEATDLTCNAVLWREVELPHD